MPMKKKRLGSARVETTAERRTPPPWLSEVRDPVVVVLKAAGAGDQAPCQVFGVDPGKRELIFTAEGTAPGLLERLAPGPGRGTVLVIEVAGLLPLGPREDAVPTRPRQQQGPDEGSLPGEPPPIRPGVPINIEAARRPGR
jgi:hypothetical protein